MEIVHIMVLIVMFILLMGVLNKHFKGFLMQSTVLAFVIYGVYFIVRGDYLNSEAFLVMDIAFLGAILFNIGYYILGHKLGVFKVEIPEDNMVTQIARRTNTIYDVSDDMKKNADDMKDKFK